MTLLEYDFRPPTPEVHGAKKEHLDINKNHVHL